MAKVGSKGAKREQLKVETREVAPREIVLIKENARFMSAAMFGRLVENIKRDGCLSSAPLCYKKGKKLICLSGNHRTKAAIEAGLKKIMVMVIRTKLDQDQLRAIQLSHNAINGEDNIETLKLIWEKIKSVEAKLYTGLSKESIENLKFPIVPPIDAKLDFEQITLLFLGEEADTIRDIAIECKRRGVLSKENWLETIENYKTIAEAVQTVCTREKVYNMATAFLVMADYAQRYMQLADNDAGEVTPATRSASS